MHNKDEMITADKIEYCGYTFYVIEGILYLKTWYGLLPCDLEAFDKNVNYKLRDYIKYIEEDVYGVIGSTMLLNLKAPVYSYRKKVRQLSEKTVIDYEKFLKFNLSVNKVSYNAFVNRSYYEVKTGWYRYTSVKREEGETDNPMDYWIELELSAEDKGKEIERFAITVDFYDRNNKKIYETGISMNDVDEQLETAFAIYSIWFPFDIYEKITKVMISCISIDYLMGGVWLPTE